MNDLLHSQVGGAVGTVKCLGQTFPSEQARREHYLKLLAEKLKDPAFRKIEGFPQGTDEAILAMSDPPYYTACPNLFLEEFVRHYGKPYDPSVKYSREPQIVDVTVGKTDALYKAHSYHTKVPHLAIVPSILHYTEPGDIVLDAFGGSGMTGVAAQWCGLAPATYLHELEMEWKKQGKTRRLNQVVMVYLHQETFLFWRLRRRITRRYRSYIVCFIQKGHTKKYGMCFYGGDLWSDLIRVQ